GEGALVRGELPVLHGEAPPGDRQRGGPAEEDQVQEAKSLEAGSKKLEARSSPEGRTNRERRLFPSPQGRGSKGWGRSLASSFRLRTSGFFLLLVEVRDVAGAVA